MSVFIKDMDMPLNCNYCDFCRVVDGHYYCNRTKHKISVYWGSRQGDCPIINILTPHGRLIDADELYEQFINEFCNRNCDESVRGEICDRCGVLRAINMIKSAPTIIEAENSSAIDDDVKKYCDYLKSETYDFCNRIENGEVNEE